MSTLKPPASGTTAKLAGGASKQRTGPMNLGGATRTRKTGAGMTTSGNKTIDLNYFMVEGVNVRPKPLMMKHVEKEAHHQEAEGIQDSQADSNLNLG